MVQTRRRRRTSNDPLEHCTDNLRNEIQGYSEASFVFQQSSPGSDRVSVLFQQTLLHTGSFLTKSILSVSKLLPRHSKVFRLVARGDLEELKKSLSLREVRLTDRDEDGRCLLNVSKPETVESSPLIHLDWYSTPYITPSQIYASFYLSMVQM